MPALLLHNPSAGDDRPSADELLAARRGWPPRAARALAASGFGWPLVAGGGLKVAYDLALLAMFRQVRPPEER
jgi:hypothetical protein